MYIHISMGYIGAIYGAWKRKRNDDGSTVEGLELRVVTWVNGSGRTWGKYTLNPELLVSAHGSLVLRF